MATDPSKAEPQVQARAEAPTHPRPRSPHLTVWRWGPHMLISILHRVTGGALSVAGLAILVWWLTAIAGTEGAFGDFAKASAHPLGRFVLIGLTWAFFQHLLSGIRHLVMDSGNWFELRTNKGTAILTLVGSLVLTLLIWVPILGGMR